MTSISLTILVLKLLTNRCCSQCSLHNVLFTMFCSQYAVHNVLFTCLLEAYWPCLECKIGCSWESRKKGEFILWKQNMCGNPFQGNSLQSWAEQQKGNILKHLEQLFAKFFLCLHFFASCFAVVVKNIKKDFCQGWIWQFSKCAVLDFGFWKVFLQNSKVAQIPQKKIASHW